ncbi:MAG: hypothetical protein IPK16_22480 [Anaerolineales bacterium]|nr:hypothetical protein [Anaerolineales bacterium]
MAKAQTPTVKVATDEMRAHQMTKAPMMMLIPPTSGEIASVVAAVVIPPAPPLKPFRNDQLCPNTAQPPASATLRFRINARCVASSTFITSGSGNAN